MQRLPQLVDLGGPKLAHPAVVPIVLDGGFFGFYFRPVVNLQWLVESPWLSTVGAEYGVGAGSVGSAVPIPGPPPATIDD
ncbi:MAG: hypothetical protein ACREBE_19915, partial [bacterium]